jgi:hypothetical protein
MHASTNRTVNHLWLPLLAVFVFSAIIEDPVCWGESRQQKFELECKVVPEPSKDNTLLTGFNPCLPGHGFLPLQTPGKRLATIAGSDACPGFILHGPPAPDYSA